MAVKSAGKNIDGTTGTKTGETFKVRETSVFYFYNLHQTLTSKYENTRVSIKKLSCLKKPFVLNNFKFVGTPWCNHVN